MHRKFHGSHKTTAVRVVLPCQTKARRLYASDILLCIVSVMLLVALGIYALVRLLATA